MQTKKIKLDLISRLNKLQFFLQNNDENNVKGENK